MLSLLLGACQTFPSYEKVKSFMPSYEKITSFIPGSWFSKESLSPNLETTALSSESENSVVLTQDLTGMSTAQIAMVFGNPSFQRKDKAVEIWQYANKICILDLFIYEKDGQKFVEYAQARLNPFEYNEDPKKQETLCLKELIEIR